ncbi:MAG TPA: 2'-5' RNA ligase family protein [Clostridia bacterium]|nr:2'-5' RNA ligase family protein [Clostridia bacterium]
MAFLVLGKLDIKESDYNWIQDFRKEHDELNYNIVYPHFTFVFPTFGKDEKEFKDEVFKKVKDFKPIDFCIRCAVINKNAFNEYWHVLLVPDEGHSEIVKLHDKLYSDVLLDTLYLEIQFVPHIGVANSKDKRICKKLVDSINSSNINICGTIKTLDVAVYDNDTVKSIVEIELK